ncbi:MAG: hypothetical protein RL069_2615 [Planctomycetota bacterium]
MSDLAIFLLSYQALLQSTRALCRHCCSLIFLSNSDQGWSVFSHVPLEVRWKPLQVGVDFEFDREEGSSRSGLYPFLDHVPYFLPLGFPQSVRWAAEEDPRGCGLVGSGLVGSVCGGWWERRKVEEFEVLFEVTGPSQDVFVQDGDLSLNLKSLSEVLDRLCA